MPTPAPARRRLEWNERWHRFRPIEYVATAVTGAGSLAVFYFAKPSDHAKWTGPILFDEPVRDALHLRTRSGLETAELTSNILAWAPAVQVVFDSVALPLAAHNPDLAWQLSLMDAESFALSGIVTASVYDVTGRARPSYAECKARKSVDPLCNVGEFAGFPSGHVSAAVTGAGLICAHHAALPLYGNDVLDVAACVEGITVATAVGVLRLMADRHYVSDVLVGGAIGVFSGYGLPVLLHYRKSPIGEVVRRDDLRVAVLPGGGATPFGAQVLGTF